SKEVCGAASPLRGLGGWGAASRGWFGRIEARRPVRSPSQNELTKECSWGGSAPPNGSRLSCGRPARRRKAVGRQSGPRQGHNTPFPLKRSPPVSFKRLLGANAAHRTRFGGLDRGKDTGN